MTVWDLKENDVLAEVFTLGPISRTDSVRYQGASGDFQPIHHDEPFAKSAGYEAPLVIGMYPAGVASLWAAQQFGVDCVRETRIRWSGRVWPGDVLTGTASIDGVDGSTRWLKMVLSNNQDELVLTLRMRFVRDGSN
tara:strand:- start:2 stop:412 length:411 start_codon:yes stop_codon:yes gene_type:complete